MSKVSNFVKPPNFFFSVQLFFFVPIPVIFIYNLFIYLYGFEIKWFLVFSLNFWNVWLFNYFRSKLIIMLLKICFSFSIYNDRFRLVWYAVKTGDWWEVWGFIGKRSVLWFFFSPAMKFRFIALEFIYCLISKIKIFLIIFYSLIKKNNSHPTLNFLFIIIFFHLNAISI